MATLGYLIGIIIMIPILLFLLYCVGMAIVIPLLGIYHVWFYIFKLPFKILYAIYKLFNPSPSIIPPTRKNQEYIADKSIEHKYIQTPDYIGMLTRIDKKKIAEEYLREEGRNKYAGRAK